MSPTDAPLSRALKEALAGRPQPLHDLLKRGSKLPGPRMNEDLAEAFALACHSIGPDVDALVIALSRMTADQAPGATALEFLPVCGLYGIGARAPADVDQRPELVMELHAHADDLRFRVREAVVASLTRVGAAARDTLVEDVASWMDGYFHAAAVLNALGNEAWLSTLRDVPAVVRRLDNAFVLVRDAPRAAARWPGYKALVESLSRVPIVIGTRFGVPVFDMLVRWAAEKDPVLREIVEATLVSRALAGRYRQELERVRDALLESRAPVRNPDHDFGPSRDRSKNRRDNRR